MSDDDNKVIPFNVHKNGRLPSPITMESLGDDISIDTDIINIEKSAESLDYINSNYAFVNDYGGKACVVRFGKPTNSEQVQINIIDERSFRSIYQNRVVQLGNRPIELGVWWLKHSNRRSYTTIDFRPNQPESIDGVLNNWRGFAVKPTKGCWKKARYHIWNILCNKDKTKFKYVIKWLAIMLQKPERPGQVALVFQGKEGTGKGVILTQFCHIFGIHGIQTGAEDLSSKFNDHISQCCYVFADEAVNPKDKHAEGILKKILTEPYLRSEQKYRKAVVVNNCVHVAMASNDEWVVPISIDGGRRFFVCRTSDEYAFSSKNPRTEKYFADLWHEAKNGGTEAMMYDLLKVDISDFNPIYHKPETKEIEEQKIYSQSREEQAMHFFIREGEFPGNQRNGKYIVEMKRLHAFLEERLDKVKQIELKKWIEYKLSIVSKKDYGTNGTEIKCLAFPELKDMKRLWKNKGLSGYSMFDDQDKWTLSNMTLAAEKGI